MSPHKEIELQSLFDTEATLNNLELKKNLLYEKKGIFIYGAGGSGVQVFDILARHNIHTKAFIDGCKTSCEACADVPVLDIDQAARVCTDDDLIVISLFSHVKNSDVKQVCAELHDRGISNYLTYAEFYHLFSSEIGYNFWLCPFDYYKGKSDEILAARALFKEDASIELFDRILSFRLTLDYDLLPHADFASQYFPSEIVDISKIRTFVSCGAYIGDTLENLINREGSSLAEAVLFEPDLENFSQLSRYCANTDGFMISLYPCGLWEEEKYIRFNGLVGVHSHIATDDETAPSVLCVSIDHVVCHKQVDFIKMDIEGAERQALQGAVNTIVANKPMLAIAVYHRPSDLWAIPKLIKSIQPDYDLYLRLHGSNVFDLVVYAIPKSWRC